jgi:hypothetical protein
LSRFFLTFAAILLASPALLGAQNPAATNPSATPVTGTARITGVVVDSLHARYLSDASIVMEGVSRDAHTDSLGRFTIDSLPAGIYRLGVVHALLDTLGISLETKPFRLGPDSTTTVILAIPSAATIVRGACSANVDSSARSAIVGRVIDPETLAPVPRAEVTLAWAEVEVFQGSRVRRTSRFARDSTDSLGVFKFCGLPRSLSATMIARFGEAVTGEIPVALGDGPVELLARTVALAPSDKANLTGNAAVSGVVTLDDSRSLAGTSVELEGTKISTVTNDKGEFTLGNLPSGSKILVLRHIGFAAALVPVELSSHAEQKIKARLSQFRTALDPVLIKARRLAALDKVGFNQRRKTSFGYYITPEQLEKVHPAIVTDNLVQVPGLRLTSGVNGNIVSSVRTTGSGCVQFYVDDTPYRELHPGDLNTFVAAAEVVAVEVYQESAVPLEYQPGGTSCTTILLWTRFKVRN